MIFYSRWSLKKKLTSIVSLCLFIQLLISFPLWVDRNRHYPKIAAFPGFELEWIHSAGFPLFVLVLFCLFAFMINKPNRFITGMFALLIVLFVLNDLNRLQVWFYQLTAILLILLSSGKNKATVAIHAVRLIIIFVYFWSGMQKLNVYFAEDIFPWLTEPFGIDRFFSRNPGLAYFAAVSESLTGIGLIFLKSRNSAVIFGFCMHVFILIALGPMGHNWNAVVWPWNICMLALIFLLFYKNEESIIGAYEKSMRKAPTVFIILGLFGIMPLFNFFNRWDGPLSFSMYSGANPEGIFYFGSQQTTCIPQSVMEKFVRLSPKSREQSIILDDWIFYELKVTPYANKKRLLQAGEKLCGCIENPGLANIKILEVDRRDKNKDRYTTRSCTELLKKVNK